MAWDLAQEWFSTKWWKKLHKIHLHQKSSSLEKHWFGHTIKIWGKKMPFLQPFTYMELHLNIYKTTGYSMYKARAGSKWKLFFFHFWIKNDRLLMWNVPWKHGLIWQRIERLEDVLRQRLAPTGYTTVLNSSGFFWSIFSTKLISKGTPHSTWLQFQTLWVTTVILTGQLTSHKGYSIFRQSRANFCTHINTHSLFRQTGEVCPFTRLLIRDENKEGRRRIWVHNQGQNH